MKKIILVFTFILVLILGQLVVFGAETVELKIATILDEDSELGKAIKLFENLTEERSKGEIDVVPYFSAVLGDEKSVVEQLGTEDIEMNVGGSGIIDWHAPSYSISSVPFMYESGIKVMEMMNKIIDERIRDLIIERVGARILGGSLRAPRNLLTVDRKILHPEDIKGLIMRLPPYPSWIKAWEALGAHPTSIPAAEQFSAIQMGVVKATENPVEVLYSLQVCLPGADLPSYPVKVVHSPIAYKFCGFHCHKKLCLRRCQCRLLRHRLTRLGLPASCLQLLNFHCPLQNP